MQQDSKQIPLLCLNSTRIQSLGTNRGPFCPFASSGVWTDFSKSLLVLRSPVLVDDPEFYLVGYSRYLSLLSWKILGYSHPGSRHSLGLGWKSPRHTWPVERHWGHWLKDIREIPTQWKGTGWGDGWKIPRNTWRLKGKTPRLLWGRRLSGLSWLVKSEPDLTLFLSCLNRICQNKSEDIPWELCSKQEGQNFSQVVMVFSGD